MYLTILKCLGVAVISYIGWCFMTVPVPKGLHNAFLARIVFTFLKLLGAYRSVLIVFGLTNTLELRRKDIDTFRKRVAKARFKREHLEIRETYFDGVKVRLYLPKDPAPKERSRPALVFYHGGGWVCGSPELSDQIMCRLVRDVSMIIVSVDYRLAPEVVFPGPLDDCVNATKYFINHAHEFGVDSGRVAIAGGSAGGNLAAAAAIKLRDDGFSPRPKLQLLIYPALQVLDLNTPSMVQNRDGPIITQEDMSWFWSQYISGSDRFAEVFLRNDHTSQEMKETLYSNELVHTSVGQEFLYYPYSGPRSGGVDEIAWKTLKDKLLNPYLSPLVAKDLHGLPDAYIFTCQYDVLRDDGIMYAKRLRNFEVKVVHSNLKCGFHGILNLLGVIPEANIVYNEILDYIKSRL